MHPIREALDRLDGLGIAYFITGSEAAACYGSIRQTFDIDVVIDIPASRFHEVAAAFEADFAVSDALDYPEFSMGSVIARATADKIDLIMRRPSAWTASSLERRRWIEHPTHGPLWTSSLEDLILAKLVWSEGTSELQLRDCAVLMRINADSIDWGYLDRWAPVLGVTGLLDQVRHAP